ncbi:MAG TPA: hypothetical protein VHC43_17360 [Mycobacteriales bacterium]|nr:hypothetical protein [Mycobacteriales bacterium]
MTGSESDALQGVACSSTQRCMAVGVRGADGGTDAISYLWDGTRWTAEPDAWSGYASLSGVSCGPTVCIAVGNSTDENREGSPLIEAWDGSTWSVMASPDPNPFPYGDGSFLTSVSCAGGGCMAVGWTGLQSPAPFAERLIAGAWTLVPVNPPDGSTGGELNGVSCASPSACIAVGFTGRSSADRLITYSWDGTAWTPQSVPSLPDAMDDGLNGVSCLSVTDCYAVGSSSEGGAHPYVTLAEHWDGVRWTATTMPVGNGFPDTTNLTAVSCPTAAVCVALGLSYNGYLAEIEQHGRWRIIPTRHPRTYELSGISCGSATSCLAVGVLAKSTPQGVIEKVAAEQWNGTAWRVIHPIIPPGSTSSALSQVSCSAPDACTVLGSGGMPCCTELAERWNGTDFVLERLATSPIPGAGTLTSISCPTATSCTAVGNAYGTKPPYELEVQHWNGRTWSLQTALSPTDLSTNSGDMGPELNAVSCPTAKRCVAVGNFVNSQRQQQPLELSSDGGAWSLNRHEVSASNRYSQLTGVGCSSARSCGAVGILTMSTGVPEYAPHWNGSTWSNGQAMALPPGGYGILQAISCAPSARCVAVGQAVYHGVWQPLVERGPAL